MRITDTKLRSLKARAERYELVEDGTGLSVRVSTRGVKTFNYLYRFDGKACRKALGVYRDPELPGAATALTHDATGLPYLTLGDARVKLAEDRRRKESGISPAQDRADERAAMADTFEEVAADFIERYSKARGRRSWKETERIFKTYVNPRLGKRPVKHITTRDIVKVLNEVADNNGGTQANRVRSAVRKFFTWAKRSQHLIEVNPALDIDKPGEEKKGTRVLSNSELRDIWAAAGTLGYPRGHFVKALLLTGRRRGQVRYMRTDQFDQEGRVWTPIEGAANKQAPELPLFQALEDLVAGCIAALPENADYLFAGSRQERAGDVVRRVSTGPINSFSELKTDLDAAIAAVRAARGASEMPPWDLSRDVRRTVKTRLAELKVPDDIRDLILGHARKGMDAVYDHSKRREEKREALEKWAAHLASIVSERGGKVI